MATLTSSNNQELTAAVEQKPVAPIDETREQDDDAEFDADGRRVSFWSFFREAGNVPLQELLKREEEAEKARSPSSGNQQSNKSNAVTQKKSKGLGLKTPSFLFKKRAAARSSKDAEVEEKEEE